MKKLIIILMLVSSSCTDKISTNNILQSQGYKEIEIKGYSIFGCSKDDIFHTKFKAKSPNGNIVEGVVCKGIFKGSTIRFN